MMLDFPSTAANRESIASVLEEIFGAQNEVRVLELASGSGQHAVYFARRYPRWSIQPSDMEPAHLQSIEAYRQEAGLPNLSAPVPLDVSSPPWPVSGPFGALWAINLIHISPWETTLGLFAGASSVLAAEGKIYLYGAYRRGGRHTAPSNQAFDRSLRERDPRWGVRCLDEVTEVAKKSGFALERVVEMPANNLSVVFSRVAR